MNTELSQLKQEVAELWTRYRQQQPQPLFGEDDERRKLAELNRTLEGKRRALAEKSFALRLEVEVHRRSSARLSPLARVLGGFLGTLFACISVASGVPELAATTSGFGAVQGVIAGGLSMLAAGLSVSRAH